MMLAVLVQTAKCKLSEHAEFRSVFPIRARVTVIGAVPPAGVEPVHMQYEPDQKSVPNRSAGLRPPRCPGAATRSGWQLCEFGEIQIDSFAERNLRFPGKGSDRCSSEGWWVCRGRLGGKQHRQDGGIGMADWIDADSTHHPGDRAVGFSLHPGRPVLETKVRQAGEQQAAGGGP